MSNPSDAVEACLVDVANAVKLMLPPETGFILLAAPFDEGDHSTPGSRLTYVANIQREQAVNILKEWLIMAGHKEDWMTRVS